MRRAYSSVWPTTRDYLGRFLLGHPALCRRLVNQRRNPGNHNSHPPIMKPLFRLCDDKDCPFPNKLCVGIPTIS